MRITKRTSIAMRLLMFCGVNDGRLVTRAEIAAHCNTSDSHLAQVIHRMARLGYLDTQRGRAGGVRLARPMSQIVIGDVFRRLEGATSPADCLADADDSCPLVGACRLRLAIADAVEAFYAHLDEVTLDALVCDNGALFALFLPAGCAKRT